MGALQVIAGLEMPSCSGRAMFSSRKYPYPTHGGDFSYDPPLLWIFQKRPTNYTPPTLWKF